MCLNRFLVQRRRKPSGKENYFAQADHVCVDLSAIVSPYLALLKPELRDRVMLCCPCPCRRVLAADQPQPCEVHKESEKDEDEDEDDEEEYDAV